MGRPPLSIEVKTKDQNELTSLLSGGVQQVRVVLRAVALLQLAKGVSAPRISSVVPLTPQAVRKVGHRYQTGGLEPALYDKQRPGAATVLESSQKQRIIAMVCSDPPEGRVRWTVRLVAQEAVKRRLVPRVGRETIRILLLDHDLKPWREKMWCVAELNDEYIAKMEERFTVRYTPTHGSWLNQAEIEIGIFSRQCLGTRRIPDHKMLRRETRAWNRRMNRDRIKINWRFDRGAARRKFGYKRIFQAVRDLGRSEPRQNSCSVINVEL